MKNLLATITLLAMLAASAFGQTIKFEQPITVTQSVAGVSIPYIQFGTKPVYTLATNPVVYTNWTVTGIPGQTVTNMYVLSNLVVSATSTNFEFWAQVPYQWFGTNGEALKSGTEPYSQDWLLNALGTNFMSQCSALVKSLGDSAQMAGQIQILSLTGSNRLAVVTQYSHMSNGVTEYGTRQLNESALTTEYGVDCNALVLWIQGLAQMAVH